MPDKPKDPRQIEYRSATIEIEETRADENGRKRHRFAISSEEPVERFFGMEVLRHTPKAIDTRFLKDGLPVFRSDRLPSLLEGGHNGTQVGLFDNHKVEDKKLRGDVRFEDTELGNETERLVETGFRRRVSIGYSRQTYTETPGKGDTPTVRTFTRWTPMELHILPLGADVTVGPGRAEEIEEPEPEDEHRTAEPAEEVETMPKEPTRGNQPPTDAPAEPAAPERGTPPAAVAEPRAERNLGQEAADIVDLCNANGLGERAAEFIRKKMTPDAVARAILDERRTAGTGQPSAEAIPAKPKDARRYSYHRAMRLAAFGDEGQFDGLEGEVHKELRSHMPDGIKYNGGILVPMRLRDPFAGRALDSVTAGAGEELVPTEQAELIELLRNRARVLVMGGRLLTGLQGPISFPKQIGAITVSWVGENPGADVGDTDVALGQLLMGPKTLQGSTAYSRQLLLQSSVDVEMMVRDDLAAGHGLAVDYGALHGTGAAGMPTGIYNAPDVQIEAFAAVPTYAEIVEMQGKIADANAEMGRLGYMTTPLMAAKLKTVPEHATAQMAGWIWVGPVSDGVMAGYRATSTKQLRGDLGGGAEQGFIYGNWGDLMVGLWNAMELVVDPYSKKKQALVEVTSFQMADVGIRHGQSFCKGTGADLS